MKCKIFAKRNCYKLGNNFCWEFTKNIELIFAPMACIGKIVLMNCFEVIFEFVSNHAPYVANATY